MGLITVAWTNSFAERDPGKTNCFKVDISQHPKAADDLGVTATPSVLIYKEGAEVYRTIGADHATLETEVPRTLMAA